MFGGALGTMAVVGLLGALSTDDNFRRIFPGDSEIGVYVGGGIVGATLPYAGQRSAATKRIGLTL